MKFEDRVSAYPNRYLMTNENGDTSYVVLERADEPVIPGTPLNAETFNSLTVPAVTNASPNEAYAGKNVTFSYFTGEFPELINDSMLAIWTYKGDGVTEIRPISLWGIKEFMKKYFITSPSYEHNHDGRYYTEDEVDAKLSQMPYVYNIIKTQSVSDGSQNWSCIPIPDTYDGRKLAFAVATFKNNNICTTLSIPAYGGTGKLGTYVDGELYIPHPSGIIYTKTIVNSSFSGTYLSATGNTLCVRVVAYYGQIVQ